MSNYVVTDIDKWLARNKKDIVDLLRKQGKRIDGFDMAKYNVIMDLWNSAERTTNTADKLRKWKNLQEKLGGIFSEAEKTTKSYDAKISKFKEDPTFQGLQGESKDKYDFWSKLNSIGLSRPDLGKEELQNLDLADVFKYNSRQLKQLAADYGYNYDDPEERKEFISKAGEYSRQRDLDKIWADDLYTTFFTPIAKEYARNNYDKIEDFFDLAPALAADVGVNTLMAVAPAKFGADVVTAPVARAGANMVLNDRPLVDAAKEATSEAATNLATPFFLRLPFRWVNRGADALVKSSEEAIKREAKDISKAVTRVTQSEINKAADKAYQIEKRLKSGAAFEGADGTIYRFTKEGDGLQKVDDADLLVIPKISKEDYEFYRKNKDLLRSKKWGPEASNDKTFYENTNLDENSIKLLEKERKNKTLAKIKENVKNGKPATEGISADDLALTIGKQPKETRFNWAKHKEQDASESALAQDAKSYVTNLLGRTRYGGSMIGSVTGAIPGLEGKVDLTVKEKPDISTDPELQMLKRMYELHQKYPTMVNKPKLPKKWEQDYTIEEIFGGN